MQGRQSIGWLVVLAAFFVVSCEKKPTGPQGPQEPTTKVRVEMGTKGKGKMSGATTKGKRSGYLDLVDGVGIVQLRADGFDKLSLKDKLLAYHLVKAAEAGHQIIYSHNHRYALEIRDWLEAIWLHPKGIDAGVLARIKHYTKLFWLNGGPYHNRNKTKFPAGFTKAELEKALAQAKKNGAKLDLTNFEKAAPLLFDPAFEPIKKEMKPKDGKDILTASGMNYYVGVTMADLKGFKEKYPLNSRLVKKDGKVIEEVFRAGDPKRKIAPGLYAKELGEVIAELGKAIEFASTEQQKVTLRELIDHLQTGDNGAFDKMNISWLKDNPRVDLILGFIEQYIDPRGIKGAYEGIISFVDPKQTKLMKAVANNAQYFEDHSPWLEIYKRKGISVPVANAIHVLVGTGDSGPFLPAGINLPNSDEIRQKHGSKSVLLTNVNQAIDRATLNVGLKEFGLPEYRDDFKRYSGVCWDAVVALHEVVGHGSGKTTEKVQGKPAKFIKEFYSALEEARADLVALHHMFDPKVVEIGLFPNKRLAEVCYRLYVQSDMLMLRRLENQKVIHDDHMRAHRLIVAYAERKFKAIKTITRDGKRYMVVSDVLAMKKAVSELLAEVMRVKAEGDYEGAKKLFETYGTTFDLSLRDEIVARAKKVGMANFHAFVNPQFELVKDASGTITDVKVVYKESFDEQMLRYSGKR